MTADLPFSLVDNVRATHTHLTSDHDAESIEWRPADRTFDEFLADLEERHIEAHEEGEPNHCHWRPRGNGCEECGGIGTLIAFGRRQPYALPCPECAGLAITPA